MDAKNRIIVALDVDSIDKAMALIKELSSYVGYFKIGLVLLKPLLHQYKWEEFIKMASKMKISLFIDEKLCHSPEVLKNTVRYYNFAPIKMFTIQASCGRDSLRAAVSQKGITIPKRMKILVSTVISEGKIVNIKSVNINEKYGKVIDPSGAGDGFLAGFLLSYLKTHDVKKASISGFAVAQAMCRRGKLFDKVYLLKNMFRNSVMKTKEF
jgi:orotidine-5'-phosphate decarboxylase